MNNSEPFSCECNDAEAANHDPVTATASVEALPLPRSDNVVLTPSLRAERRSFVAKEDAGRSQFSSFLYLTAKPRSMNATTSFELLALTEEFIPDKDKAKAFVQKIDALMDSKFEKQRHVFLTKEDKVDLMRTIYLVGLVQFLAIVGSVLAIVTFMLG